MKVRVMMGLESVSQLPDDWEVYSDEFLGARLIWMYICGEAQMRGATRFPLPAEFADGCIERLQRIEAQTFASLALEKALNLAAHGRFAEGGKIFRAFMLQDSERTVLKKYAEIALGPVNTIAMPRRPVRSTETP